MARRKSSLPTSLFILLMTIEYSLSDTEYNNRTPVNANAGSKYAVLDGLAVPTSQNQNSDAQPNADKVVVDSKMGSLQGLVTKEGTKRVTTKFLGIPFALPPTRERRFLPPVRHFGWSLDRIYDATYFRKLCHQNRVTGVDSTLKKSDSGEILFDDFDDDDNYKTPELDQRYDEDCLYLNLYIPRNISAEEHVNTLGLSVMVFIHGGDLNHDTAGLNLRHDGQTLADKGDVIVATIDYRQGIFGYFSTLEGMAPGNVGLLDQRLALHWIWDNIQEFGGNPGQITVFGDGKGAESIGLHILSPMSKGLFGRAILQSGSMLSPDVLQNSPAQNSQRVISLLGCEIYDNDTDKVACLRSEPVAHLLTASAGLQWAPVIDGSFLTGNPYSLLKHGQHNKVAVIIGVDVNHADGMAIDKGYSPQIGVTKSELELTIRQTLGPKFSRKLEQVVALTLTEYDFCEKTPAQRFRVLHDFLLDYYFLFPSYEAAMLLSLGGGERQVYLYEFSHDVPGRRNGNEFVFGEALRKEDSEEAKRNKEEREERELSMIIMEGWSNFASQGDPNPINLRGGTYWFPFNATYERYLDITVGMGHTAAKAQIRRRSTAFWEFVATLRDDVEAEEEVKDGRETTDEEEDQGTCEPGRDVCAHRVRSVQEEKQHTARIMWILAGCCGLLLLLMFLLLLKLFLPSSAWQYTHPSPTHKLNTSISDPDRRYLRPLPYYDET